MSNFLLKNFFPGKKWQHFIQEVINKLDTESILLTAVPEGGKRFFLKMLEEELESNIKDKNLIVISFEIIPKETKIYHLSAKILELLNYKLNFPRFLQDLNCYTSLLELVKRGKEILIIINYFERLKNESNSMIFLESLRGINQLKIKYLIGCDISCLIVPDKYKKAGILMNSNLIILPPFTKNETKKLLERYRKYYKWNISKKAIERIYKLSGGVPGLVKYISKYISNNKNIFQVSDLVNDLGIKYKLENFIETLRINKLILHNKFNLEKKQILYDLEILDKNNNLRIKLLEPFLKNKPYTKSKLTLMKLLSSQENKIYKILKDNPDKIYSCDEISDILWGKESSEKYSLWSIYKTISKLNNKIKNFGFYIRNFKGRGYSIEKN